MTQRIFGLETEYAFAALGRDGKRLEQATALSSLMEAACTLPHLPAKLSSGIFLQNGSRFYIDTGGHPELSTCEVVDPWDACRYVLAGDMILAELSRQMITRQSSIHHVVINRSNICYDPANLATWGCHESYGHCADSSDLANQIIPHLVSRVIYTGAGGFDNHSTGIQFMLSPRVAHLTQTVSNSSTNDRGILHTKDESLSSGGWRRFHVLCGESLCSQTAMWLKSAITALVVAMVDARLRPCRGIRLKEPLAAMRAFSMDPTCTAQIEAHGGKMWTAIGIQRQILRQIERHLKHRALPPWAPEACSLLRNILNALEQAPDAASKTLDWSIKLALYQELARRRGIRWESLVHFNRILTRLDQTNRERQGPAIDARLNANVFGFRSPISDEIRRLSPLVSALGLQWKQFENVLALRQDLFSLDTRFSQIGSEGIFGVLDRSGALQHCVPGVDRIERAVTEPPAVGRARLRGECIKRFSRDPANYSCDWTGILDERNHRFLDLADPFAAVETWGDLPKPEVQVVTPPRPLHELLDTAWSLHGQDRFEDAWSHMGHLCSNREMLEPERRFNLCRLCAMLRSRRGTLDGPRSLQQIAEVYCDPFQSITDHVAVYRFHGLVPSPEIVPWIERGLEFLRAHRNHDRAAAAEFHEHYAYFLIAEGRTEVARAVLEMLDEAPASSFRSPRVRHRVTAMLGEVCRRLKDFATAMPLLEKAAAEQAVARFHGDLANYTLPYMSKLQKEASSAQAILLQAKTIQAGCQDRIGEARTLLLEARVNAGVLDVQALRNRILELKEAVPALNQCRLLGRVLQQWNEWTNGVLTPDETGDVFWGV